MDLQTSVVQPVIKAFRRLSPSERVYAIAAAVIIFALTFYSFVISPTQEAFARQASELHEMRNTFDFTPDVLTRYSKLEARRKEIKQFYEKAGMKAEPLTHLETLIRDVMKLPRGAYTLTPGQERLQPDGEYVHRIISVKFDTTSLEDLSRFLHDVVAGAQPMLISQISLDKRLSSDVLGVQLEVSGFEPANK